MGLRNALKSRITPTSLVFFSVFCVMGIDRAVAQVAPEVEGVLSSSPLSEVNPLDKPQAQYTGLDVAGFLLYPKLFVGSVFDDNLFQTPSDKKSAIGVELTPSFTALLDNGIHKTAVYGQADFRIYPSESDADLTTGNFGLIHVYQIDRDLIFRIHGDVTRADSIYSSGAIGSSSIRSPQLSTTYLGEASLKKSFDRLFVSLGGSVSRAENDPIKDAAGATLSQSFRDGTTTTVNTRIGYWVSPVFNAFVEPSYNWQSYVTSADNSQGYRVVAGLNTERISLFKGEIYGGYQDQQYHAPLGSSGGGVFGGNIFYYPTPALTLSLNAAQTLGLGSLSLSGFAGATRTDTVAGTVAYELSQVWSATAGLTYQWVEYIGDPRRDEDFSMNAEFDYHLWKNTNATIKYQYTDVASNAAFQSFDRNVISLGVTYKY